MYNFFTNCYLLTSIKFSENFYSSNAESMRNIFFSMFNICHKLKYLEIPNFSPLNIIGKGNKNNKNCEKCKLNYISLNYSIYNNNCYEKCTFYYYFNETKDYICTEDNNCPSNYNKLIIEKKKCIEKCENDSKYKYEYDNICYEEYPNGKIYDDNASICKEEIKVKTSIINIGNNKEFTSIKSTEFLSQIFKIKIVSTSLEDDTKTSRIIDIPQNLSQSNK